jgi:dihydrofolate reductase/thymidylate synthase
MFDIIVACCKNGGIGFNGFLPWKIPEEMKIFKEKIKDSILIVGRKTFEKIPKLNNEVIIVSKNNMSFEKALEKARYESKEIKKIFVIGGGEIYKEAFKHPLLDKIHISILESEFICDTFINFKKEDWVMLSSEKYNTVTPQAFTHYVFERSEESEYLSLLKKVYEKELRNSRNSLVKSCFFNTLQFDLTKGFPLLTTKKMFFKGIVEELLFFLRGDTDTSILEKKGINIWKGNTDRKFLDSIGKTERKEGVMGPMYGYQWRFFGTEYNEETTRPKGVGIDQLEYVIDLIKNDPCSRRIIMTDFNPLQASEGVLYPCHSLIVQFYVEDGFLDMSCYNRSQDLFHGVPFNIASSALLLSIIANITDLKPRFFNMVLGDTHIYKDHFSQVETQLKREMFKFPKLNICKKINLETIPFLCLEDFSLINYVSGDLIKASMVA